MLALPELQGQRSWVGSPRLEVAMPCRCPAAGCGAPGSHQGLEWSNAILPDTFWKPLSFFILINVITDGVF